VSHKLNIIKWKIKTVTIFIIFILFFQCQQETKSSPKKLKAPKTFENCFSKNELIETLANDEQLGIKCRLEPELIISIPDTIKLECSKQFLFKDVGGLWFFAKLIENRIFLTLGDSVLIANGYNWYGKKDTFKIEVKKH
jgi:hypothetical protein